MRNLLVILILVLSLATVATTGDSFNTGRFYQWFEGEFDNFAQTMMDKENKLENPHSRRHSLFYRVSVPALGNNVFFVEQYSNDDKEKVDRRRLYAFDDSPVDGTLRMRIFALLEEEKYLHAHLQPEKLAGISEKDLKGFPNCDIFWRRDGENYVGSSKEGACTFESSRDGNTYVIKDEIVLSNDQISIMEQIYSEDGMLIGGRQDAVPSIQKKCRFFTGWAVFKKEKSDDYHVVRGIRLHDQGETVRLISNEGRDMGYSVQLAQLVYTQTNVAVFKLSILEGDNPKPIFYLWSEPDSERIGINHRWMQVGLTLEK